MEWILRRAYDRQEALFGLRISLGAAYEDLSSLGRPGPGLLLAACLDGGRMSLAEKLQFLPLLLNVVVCVLAVAEGSWGKALYWGGAAVITVGVIMQKG